MLGVFRKFGSISGNIVGGYLADKFGTARLMLLAFIVMFAGQGMMLMMPAKHSSVVVVAVLFVTILIFFHMNYAMAWTMMSEGAVPVEYSGTAAGLICTAGAIPETLVSLLAGNRSSSGRDRIPLLLLFPDGSDRGRICPDPNLAEISKARQN